MCTSWEVAFIIMGRIAARFERRRASLSGRRRSRRRERRPVSGQRSKAGSDGDAIAVCLSNGFTATATTTDESKTAAADERDPCESRATNSLIAAWTAAIFNFKHAFYRLQFAPAFKATTKTISGLPFVGNAKFCCKRIWRLSSSCRTYGVGPIWIASKRAGGNHTLAKRRCQGR